VEKREDVTMGTFVPGPPDRNFMADGFTSIVNIGSQPGELATAVSFRLARVRT